MRRAILFANGRLTDPQAARALIAPSDVIVAADGGAHHCRALGLRPQVVVGDLDSLAPDLLAELTAADVLIELYPPDKDETDLELALRAALRLNVTQVIILAGLGGRWDQSLANLLLLAHRDFAALDLKLIDGPDTFVVVRDRAVFQGAPGDQLSLLPLAGDAEAVTLKGLRYPLKRGTLRYGLTRGLSNVFVQAEAVVTLGRGILLAVHSRVIRPRQPDGAAR